jgi:hypothetical protein
MYYRDYQVYAQKVLHSHFIYMDYLKAKSWKNALVGERQEALKNPKFAYDIGRMILLDAFTGNIDRLQIKNFNAGNIMLHKNELALVDNEFKLSIVDFPEVEKRFRELISKDSFTVCQKLVDQLNMGKEGALIDKKDLNPIYENVHKGLIEGIKPLLSLLEEDETIEESLKSLPPSFDIQKEALIRITTILKEQLKQMEIQ